MQHVFVFIATIQHILAIYLVSLVCIYRVESTKDKRRNCCEVYILLGEHELGSRSGWTCL